MSDEEFEDDFDTTPQADILNFAIQATDDKSLKDALRKNKNDEVSEILGSMKHGVIVVSGRMGSGKDELAEKLAYLFYKKGFPIDVTFDYRAGYAKIRPKRLLLVKQGKSEAVGKDATDTYGSEQYHTFTQMKGSVSIVISNNLLTNRRWVDLSFDVFYKEGGEVVALWYTSTKAIGSVTLNILDDDNDEQEKFIYELEDKIDTARLDYYKSELERFRETVPRSTKKILRRMWVDEEIIRMKPIKDKDDNAIKAMKVCLFGDSDAGKSTLAKILKAQSSKKYATYGIKHKNDIGLLYHKGFSKEKKYFSQMLFVEDSTYNLTMSEVVADWHIRVRHLMNEATGGTEEDRSKGLQHAICTVLLAIHRMTGKAIPLRFRNSFDYIFILDLPTLKHDRDYIKGVINPDRTDLGETAYDFLVWLNRERLTAQENGDHEYLRSLLGYALVVMKDNEVFPVRFHTDDFPTEIYDTLGGSSKWHDTFEEIALEVIKRVLDEGYEPTIPIISNIIDRLELERYGYIRPPSDKGVNYRSVVKNWVKAEHDRREQQKKWGSSTTSTISDVSNDGNGNLNKEDKKSWQYKLLKVTPATNFIKKLVGFMHEKLDQYNGIDKNALEAYYIWVMGEPQNSTKIGKLLTPKGQKKIAQSSVSRLFSDISTYMGYEFEAYMESILGEEVWERGGNNDSAPDLNSDLLADTISCKYRRNRKFTPSGAGSKKGKQRVIGAGERQKYENGHRLFVLLYEAEMGEMKLWRAVYDNPKNQKNISNDIPHWYRNIELELSENEITPVTIDD